MISIRQLLIIALVIGGFWLIHRLRQRRPLQNRRSRNLTRYHDTVQCARCGVYLSKTDALGSATEGYYCCEQHWLTGPDR